MSSAGYNGWVCAVMGSMSYITQQSLPGNHGNHVR